MACLKGWRVGEKDRWGKDLGWDVCLHGRNLTMISWGRSILSISICARTWSCPIDHPRLTILVKQLFLSFSVPHWTHEQKEKADSFD